MNTPRRSSPPLRSPEQRRGDPANTREDVPEQEPEWQRRRRLAAVFGDSTPEQTSDDTDAREDKAGKGDAWYRDQVPPHHG